MRDGGLAPRPTFHQRHGPAMIPRPLVARALGLPDDTDALPQGDLPMGRFMTRYIAYLATTDAATDAPDAWTGALMDHLIAEHPALALAAITEGAGMARDDLLIDPLAELSNAGFRGAIAQAAEASEALASLLIRGQDMLDDDR